MVEGYLEESHASHLGTGGLLRAPDRFVLLVTSFARGQCAGLEDVVVTYHHDTRKKQGTLRGTVDLGGSVALKVWIKEPLGRMLIKLPSCKSVCRGEQGAPREGHCGPEVLQDPDLFLGLHEGRNGLWVDSTGPILS